MLFSFYININEMLYIKGENMDYTGNLFESIITDSVETTLFDDIAAQEEIIENKDLYDAFYASKKILDSPSRYNEIQTVAPAIDVNSGVVVIKGVPPQQKRASIFVEPTMNAESRVLAREYAKYQISLLTGIGADKYAHRVIVHNHAQA